MRLPWRKKKEPGPEEQYQKRLSEAPKNSRSVRRQTRWLKASGTKRLGEQNPDRRSRYNDPKGRDDGK